MCVQSPHYPQSYGSDERCTIAMIGGASVPINVVRFDTEDVYDTLTVNEAKYGGSAGPVGVIPMGNIEWHSDYSVAGAGWKLCHDWAASPP